VLASLALPVAAMTSSVFCAKAGADAAVKTAVITKPTILIIVVPLERLPHHMGGRRSSKPHHSIPI
jgi:hypothetical protein